MQPMFFVASKSVTIDSQTELKMVAGPYSSREKAIAAAEGFTQAAEYVIYGPADAVHAVTITKPQVSSNPL